NLQGIAPNTNCLGIVPSSDLRCRVLALMFLSFFIFTFHPEMFLDSHHAAMYRAHREHSAPRALKAHVADRSQRQPG
ncbi:hypothetical protein Bpfe_012264, partial [Biomphalaria pfeifferi]